MRRAALLLLPLALVPAACGGSGGAARSELRQTAQRLGEIRSGDLTLKLLVSPTSGTKGRIGFDLHGPFELRSNALPVADLQYTQYAGSKQATATFVSTGAQAYALVDGKRVALPATATAELRSAAGGLGVGGGSGGGLRIDSWLQNPSVSDGGTVGGAPTDHISAKLDVVNAANGLLAFVRALGHAAPTISGNSADQLRKAVKSSSIDVWTGKKDHLLRRLDLKARLGFDVPKELQRALGSIVGANFEFELAVSSPNRPIHIAAPS
jgi:hypothetical protein